MKIFTFITLLLLVTNISFAQDKTSSAVSKKIFISISQVKTLSAVSNRIFISIDKEAPKPPYLEIKNYSFLDADGNKKINAGESCSISFDLFNSGMGPGLGLVLSVQEKNNISGLNFSQSIKLPELQKDEKQQIIIPIEGLFELQSATALFSIVIDEANGFDSDPLVVEIETKSFKAPLVKMVDYQVTSRQSKTLERRKPFNLEVLVQNLGQGTAQNVTISVQKPTNTFCLSSNEKQIIEEFKPGEKRILTYTFITNTEYQGNSIDFKIRINEKYNQYAEDGNVALSMNQRVSGEKLIIKGVVESNVAIQLASLTSDVDKNIPTGSTKHPNKIALIIGNEDYSGSINSEINVDYAVRDAEVFREYAIKTLGIPAENVYLKRNATVGVMNSSIELISELVKRMKYEPEIIFYYAGHGFPDEKSHTPYLIPVDVNATNLNSAIALKDIYRKFGNTGAEKITILLDACFSGGGRNQGLLAARGILIKPKKEEMMGNMIVFSASTGEQSSLPYHDKKHGMFTYYLLKKLQESNGTVTFGVLDDYLRDNVGIKSLQINGKIQDPTTTTSPVLQDKWKDLTF